MIFYVPSERAMDIRPFIVLFKSVVRCLLSTGAPALRSLHDIWSTPVAFLIFILLTSLNRLKEAQVVPLHKKMIL
jgi:hypothetical protein